MSGGALWVKPYGKEKLIRKEVPRGSALCWRGDIGHGGDAYPGGGRKGQYRFFLQVNAGGRPISKRATDSSKIARGVCLQRARGRGRGGRGRRREQIVHSVREVARRCSRSV